MLDLNQLKWIDKDKIFISLKHFHENKINRFIQKYDNIMEELPPYHLQDLDKVTGLLLMVAIDPDDSSIGYCIMEVGDEIYKVVINNPEKVFRNWEKDPGIYFATNVAIIRLDSTIAKYKLKYISDEEKESSKDITEYIMARISE